MKKRSFVIGTIFLMAGLIIGLVLSSNFGLQSNGFSSGKSDGKRAALSADSSDILAAYSEAMVAVVESVTPSVVNIATTRTVTSSGGGGNPFDDPFFRQFFGDNLFKKFGSPKQEKRGGLGSGVIVNGGGYILTNNHVIKDADKITVTLRDKREFEAKVVGSDPKTDIAVLQIEAEDNLPAIKWGDSDSLRVGEMVLAVGSPYGLNQSVTQGIVSAKGRANVNIADYEDFIQTDAAINPGNSGGPLINVHGELVGINTAIFSTSGGYQGIGFSIPSNMVRVIMDSLIKYQKVVRGWLGVSIQTIDKDLAGQFGLDSEVGALVSEVLQDSPAEEGGLKRGDIITRYDGKEVKGSLELRNMVASTQPDSKVVLNIIRDGKDRTLKIKIGELPGDVAASIEGDYDNALNGVTVQGLTPEIRKELKVSRRIEGVVVTADSPDAGLKRGDIIMEINRRAVESASDYHEAVSTLGHEDSILLLVYRGGRTFYMTIAAEE